MKLCDAIASVYGLGNLIVKKAADFSYSIPTEWLTCAWTQTAENRPLVRRTVLRDDMKQESDTCIYCGVKRATTRSCPPEADVPDPKPSDLVSVPHVSSAIRDIRRTKSISGEYSNSQVHPSRNMY